MAFVADGAQSMSVTFEDRDKNQSTVDFYVPAAVVSGDITTFVTGDLPTTLGALSNAGIRRVTVSKSWEQDTWVVPVEASDVQRKGVFPWLASDRSKSRNEIPSIKNELVIDGTDFILQSDAAVTAFVAMVVDAGLLDVYGLGNYRGVKITGLDGVPYKRHRKSTRG